MKFKKIFLVSGLLIVLIIAAFYFLVRPKYVVPILTYHHIDEKGKTSSLSVSPENFDRQMEFLSGHNYDVISLGEFIQLKEKKINFARNTVVITFDDGYEDNYISAYPILKKYNLAATIFIIANFIGREGYLNQQQIKEMLSSGLIIIGSHTLTEAFLPGRSRRELEREIGLSKAILESKFNKRVDFFCYPFGHFSPDIQEIVKKYGYKAACSTNRGRKQTWLNDDLLALKRIKVKDSSNFFVFWAKLSGYYNLFRRVRKPY